MTKDKCPHCGASAALIFYRHFEGCPIAIAFDFANKWNLSNGVQEELEKVLIEMKKGVNPAKSFPTVVPPDDAA